MIYSFSADVLMGCGTCGVFGFFMRKVWKWGSEREDIRICAVAWSYPPVRETAAGTQSEIIKMARSCVGKLTRNRSLGEKYPRS